MERTTSSTTAPLGSLRARATKSLGTFLARYPYLNGDRLLRESGLDPSVLGDLEARYSLRSMLLFLENAANASGDDGLAVEIAAQLPLADLDVLGYVLLHSSTLGSGLENACRYFAVQQTLGRLSLTRGPVQARLSYSLSVPSGVQTRQHFALVLAVVVKYCREATGRADWTPLEVHFSHNAPSNVAQLERFFGAPLRFGVNENALILPLADLEIPLGAADPELLPILQRHANDLLARIPRSGHFVDGVRRQLAETLSTGSVAIEDVASRLKTTPRSLQRRLREAGSSYQEILAETRLALAQRYLYDRGLSLTEIAFLLGYSDLSAFSRAYRRWTGHSPADARRRSA